MPTTADGAVQRTATLLLNEPRTAGAHVENSGDVFYGLSRWFCRKAERKLSSSGKKYKRSRFNRRVAHIEGCWVCGEDHLASNFHTPNEITAARRKQKKNAAYVAVGDVMSVFFEDDNSDSTSDSNSDTGENAASIAMTQDEV